MAPVTQKKQVQNWLADSKLASVLRVFVVIVLTQASLEFSKVGSFDFSNWQSWLIVAIASTVPMLARILNPSDELS